MVYQIRPVFLTQEQRSRQHDFMVQQISNFSKTQLIFSSEDSVFLKDFFFMLKLRGLLVNTTKKV